MKAEIFINGNDIFIISFEYKGIGIIRGIYYYEGNNSYNLKKKCDLEGIFWLVHILSVSQL